MPPLAIVRIEFLIRSLTLTPSKTARRDPGLGRKKETTTSMKTTSLITIALLAGTLGAAANESIYDSKDSSVYSSTCFTSQEIQFDAFGTTTDRGRLGGGVGANYFFDRLFGAGVETRVEDFDWPNQVVGNLIFRYPFEQCRLAPYVFGGGGRQFRDGTQWLADVGIGAEYRLHPAFGLFLDVRETFPEHSADYALWRLGIRFKF